VSLRAVFTFHSYAPKSRQNTTRDVFNTDSLRFYNSLRATADMLSAS